MTRRKSDPVRQFRVNAAALRRRYCAPNRQAYHTIESTRFRSYDTAKTINSGENETRAETDASLAWNLRHSGRLVGSLGVTVDKTHPAYLTPKYISNTRSLGYHHQGRADLSIIIGCFKDAPIIVERAVRLWAWFNTSEKDKQSHDS